MSSSPARWRRSPISTIRPSLHRRSPRQRRSAVTISPPRISSSGDTSPFYAPSGARPAHFGFSRERGNTIGRRFERGLMAELRFQLNGEQRQVSTRPGESLLETLRERCDVRSTKNGCQPQGQCGCCLASGGRHAEGHLRDAGRQSGGQGDPDSRRPSGERKAADRPQLRDGGWPAVWVLHPRDRAAGIPAARKRPGSEP